MRFWDTSAIVPLIVTEATTKNMEVVYQRDPAMTVWWATEVECVSAVSRLERDAVVAPEEVATSLVALQALARAWTEIEPARRVRELAIRLLRTHSLRAADALQLAAAIVAAEERPATLGLVTLDDRLAESARREGFAVQGLVG